jgi:hypothetical protein
VLALVSVIQVTSPGLLRTGPEGFTVDLTPLEKKPQLTSDELLVVRLHEVFAAGGETYAVELSAAEAARLGGVLKAVARARQWPPAVKRKNSNRRARLQTQEELPE